MIGYSEVIAVLEVTLGACGSRQLGTESGCGGGEIGNAILDVVVPIIVQGTAMIVGQVEIGIAFHTNVINR